MKISEFEEKTGLSRDTLRYYEKIGMLSPPLRGANGYREYGQAQLSELSFIQMGKEIGFTLSTIKEGYRRYKALGKLCPEFKQQLVEKKEMLSKRMDDDARAIKKIDEMLS